MYTLDAHTTLRLIQQHQSELLRQNRRIDLRWRRT